MTRLGFEFDNIQAYPAVFEGKIFEVAFGVPVACGHVLDGMMIPAPAFSL